MYLRYRFIAAYNQTVTKNDQEAEIEKKEKK